MYYVIGFDPSAINYARDLVANGKEVTMLVQDGRVDINSLDYKKLTRETSPIKLKVVDDYIEIDDFPDIEGATIFSREDMDSIPIATHIFELSKGIKKDMVISARIQNQQYKDFGSSDYYMSRYIKVKAFNEHDIAAQIFFQQHPPKKEVGLIGYNDQTVAYAKTALELGHFVSDNPDERHSNITFYVDDTDIISAKKALEDKTSLTFKAFYGNNKENERVDGFQAETEFGGKIVVQSKKALKDLENKDDVGRQLIFCEANDEKSMEEAGRVIRWRKAQLDSEIEGKTDEHNICTNNYETLTKIFKSPKELFGGENVHFVPTSNKYCTHANIDLRLQDGLASVIHYMSSSRNRNDFWETTTEEDREVARAKAGRIVNNVKRIIKDLESIRESGLSRIDWEAHKKTAVDNVTKWYFGNKLSPSKIETEYKGAADLIALMTLNCPNDPESQKAIWDRYARSEHDGACTSYSIRGWRKCSALDRYQEAVYKDKFEKKDPCLVPYSELKKISDLHDTNYAGLPLNEIFKLPQALQDLTREKYSSIKMYPHLEKGLTALTQKIEEKLRNTACLCKGGPLNDEQLQKLKEENAKIPYYMKPDYDKGM